MPMAEDSHSSCSSRIGRPRWVLGVAAAALAMAGCSDDSPYAIQGDRTPTTVAATSPVAKPVSLVPSGGSEAPGGAASEGDEVAPNGESVTVVAIDNTFRPEAIEISAGTEVVWNNRGRNEHNVVPLEGDAWGVATADFGPKASYSHVFTVPGTYPYYCSIHGTATVGMVGTIVVTG
ncbi:MAG: plastocyanin/azurin family copper-binding protein [Ilumatobacteraceae bacterium]